VCWPHVRFCTPNKAANLPDFRRRPKALAMLTLIITGRDDRALYPHYPREFAE
jgi:hypothetical protein